MRKNQNNKTVNTFQVNVQAKELISKFQKVTIETPRKYKMGICRDMEDCLNNILHLLNKCNDIPLNRCINGLSPTKELLEERLHYHIEIRAEIHTFQNYLEIASEIKDVYPEKIITSLGDCLGKLQKLTDGWTSREVKIASAVFPSLTG